MRITAGRPVVGLLALLLAAISLLFNVYLVWQFRHPAKWADRALRQLTGADSTGLIHYTVRIPPGTPLSLDIPVHETFRIGVDTVFPIDTRVRVPIRGPLGTAYVNVPIRASVPIRTQVPLEVNHTFQLRTRTTRPIEIPLQIRPSDLLH